MKLCLKLEKGNEAEKHLVWPQDRDVVEDSRLKMLQLRVKEITCNINKMVHAEHGLKENNNRKRKERMRHGPKSPHEKNPKLNPLVKKRLSNLVHI